MEEMSGSVNDNVKITVKFNGRSIPMTTSVNSKIDELKANLQPLTNVLPRGQKLIFKGKVLVDKMTLRESEVMDGAKIMLMAAQGLHQGDGPLLKEAKRKEIVRKSGNDGGGGKERIEVPVGKSRLERWKSTGVVALAECNLKAIPNEVWTCGTSARVLDINNNFVQSVPDQIRCLSSIQKLFLNANGLSDESICWEGLSSLKHLTNLSLSQNQLTVLPAALGALTSLRQLNVANNKLTCLPTEIGQLTQLEILKVNNNRLSNIPTSIASCHFLLEIDLSSNLLLELPETFTNLHRMKELHLSNNGLKSLPSGLFKMCLQLSTLDLHNTEITMDTLRQSEGWGEFDERRRSKHQKQLDFRVVSAAKFDEGADKK
ncbi:hypothetical protein ACFE04_015314 [Oxalis oulophora]